MMGNVGNGLPSRHKDIVRTYKREIVEADEAKDTKPNVVDYKKGGAVTFCLNTTLCFFKVKERKPITIAILLFQKITVFLRV